MVPQFYTADRQEVCRGLPRRWRRVRAAADRAATPSPGELRAAPRGGSSLFGHLGASATMAQNEEPCQAGVDVTAAAPANECRRTSNLPSRRCPPEDFWRA